MRVQFWLKVNIARLGPTCTVCCVRSITYNEMTSGTQKYTYARMHTHTHAHTHAISQSVQRNDEYKILWVLNIQTDKVIEYRLPDIICICKKNKGCQIIDFAVPADQNITIKGQEKIDKYQLLITELQKV